MSRAGVAFLVVALAGCAASATDPVATAEEGRAAPEIWQLAAEGCYTTAVFFLVEYHQADRFLPPAFHPRDLAAFLYHTPVTSGKVPAFVALSTCEGITFDGPQQREGAMQITYIGFFVQPPTLGDAYAARPADYDFYSVAYLGPHEGPAAVPFEVSDEYGWRNEVAQIVLDVVSEAAADSPLPPPGGLPLPDRAEALTSSGRLRQEGNDIFSFSARAVYPQSFDGAPKLRFWHESPRGLGWMEFDLPMQTVSAGPLGGCMIAPGSLVHEVVGHVGNANLCGPLNSFALVFGEHQLTGRLHHLEGEHGAMGTAPVPAGMPPGDAAAMRVLVPLDVEQAVTLDTGTRGAGQDPPGAGDHNLCDDGASTSVPADRWTRYDHPFIVGTEPTPFVRFRDDYQENGCGEAQFRLTVPAGAKTMALTFQVDRQVESQTGATTPRAFQTLLLYVDGDEGLERVECFGEQEVFPPSWPSTPRVQDFTARLDLTRCIQIFGEDLRGRDIVVGFAFRDGGPIFSGQQVPDGLPAGQLFRAAVYGPQVVFDGIQLPLQRSAHAGLDPGRDVVGFVSRSVHVPAPLPGQMHEVSFSIGNQHGILGLYERSERGLHRLPDEKIQAREVDGRLVYTIPTDVLAGPGGQFEVLFSAPDAGRVSMVRMPMAVLAMVIPLVAGAVAQRNLNQVHQVARQRDRRDRYLLQILLAGCWLLYLGVAVWLFMTDAGLGMAAWPVPGPNLAAYLLLAAVAAGMVAVAVASRRLELRFVRRDVSDLELAQRELERSNRELEQFAYVASHDLKEPLRIVAGYTQLLSMRYGDRLDEKGRGFLGHATAGASRLQRMVDDLLAYSRVRRDPAGSHAVKLDEAMAAVRMHLKGIIEDRGVDLRASELPHVMAERGQTVQLLLNLVQNAIKFSPQARPVVEIGAAHVGDAVQVWVRDEGIGIEARQQERIFHIFQRLHLREEYDGNGIGLAVCRKIVEQCGGRIWVESAPGRGSTFRFTLPAADAGRPVPPVASRPTPRPSPGTPQRSPGTPRRLAAGPTVRTADARRTGKNAANDSPA